MIQIRSCIFLTVLLNEITNCCSKAILSLNSIPGREESLNSSLISTVIGGNRSPPRPFYVQVTRYDTEKKVSNTCGGTVIHDEWVLTAAHCVHDQDADDVRIVVGDFTDATSAKEKVLVEIIYWPADFLYARVAVDNDIALIKVSNYSFEKERILSVCGGYADECTIMGACGTGRTSHNSEALSPFLKEILLYERPPGLWDFSSDCSPDKVCTRRISRGRDDNLFHGDSGGPLYVFGEFPDNKPICVYGVASFCGKWSVDVLGFHLFNCYYGGSYFANVPYFVNWIDATIRHHYVQYDTEMTATDSSSDY
ncbi:chymotrypsin-like elastase family member 2A isoform X2 [Symsagittifera roscoffensis]|uniref:chymotrypsin-like elastase family member 2A isoform X2 n=1 Tax=Symsagittifera roscoffensis TaxID=84072 RepID=UPI00307C27C2